MWREALTGSFESPCHDTDRFSLWQPGWLTNENDFLVAKKSHHMLTFPKGKTHCVNDVVEFLRVDLVTHGLRGTANIEVKGSG